MEDVDERIDRGLKILKTLRVTLKTSDVVHLSEKKVDGFWESPSAFGAFCDAHGFDFRYDQGRGQYIITKQETA